MAYRAPCPIRRQHSAVDRANRQLSGRSSPRIRRRRQSIPVSHESINCLSHTSRSQGFCGGLTLSPTACSVQLQVVPACATLTTIEVRQISGQKFCPNTRNLCRNHVQIALVYAPWLPFEARCLELMRASIMRTNGWTFRRPHHQGLRLKHPGDIKGGSP